MKRARALRPIATNPVEDAAAPKVERREIEVLEPHETAALLDAAKTTRLFPIVFLAVGTGLRRGEVLGLRWSDIDFEKRTLTVAQSREQTKAGLRFKAPKTKRSRRTIALSPSVVEVLQAHRARQGEERLALGLGRDAAGIVFTRIDGELIQPDSITKIFTRIVKRADIKPISFHALRHTHITELHRTGVYPRSRTSAPGTPALRLRWMSTRMPSPACRRMPRYVLMRRSEGRSRKARVANRVPIPVLVRWTGPVRH